MNTINRLWHELVLRHGDCWVEMSRNPVPRKHGVLVECDCGKRWLSRAPWDRMPS
jgi:hypothetical protein